MLSLGKNTKPFLFLICFISYRHGDAWWRDKDVLSHSSLLQGSEDVCESAQPSVPSGDGFGSFYMSLPQDRAVFAWHTKMVSDPDWHKWGSRIKNYRGNCSSYEEGLWLWDAVLFFQARGSWLLAAGYWQLSNIILIVIKMSITCSSGNRRNSPDGKGL